MSRSRSRSRSPSKGSTVASYKRKKDKERGRSSSRDRSRHKKSHKEPRHKSSKHRRRSEETPKAYRGGRSRSSSSSSADREIRKESLKKRPRRDKTLEATDPFEIRRRKLIRMKEIATEVERKLAELLPKKLEEEIDLRKEKIRLDLKLEMEEQIRNENNDLARINLELRE
ncbi:arginine and glutamate-rich protein 1-B-like, partial [Galendromus occidentalis]|uniref:Arginine and glutamate-rich protein 1-B-like n=1 Tax=Galendromus occidentalis TaxID=34638 RepID=A0AAJ7SI91_9ACAR